MDELSKELRDYISRLPAAEKQRLIKDIFLINSMSKSDICWCGSDETFENCHLNRQAERKILRSEEGHVQKQMFEKQELCCAEYDSEHCIMPIKGAHTIQRSRVLSSMAQDGHVGTFYRNYEGSILDKDVRAGIKSQASIFYGFCSYHDTEIFKTIEVTEFSALPDNCWATSYRAICHEFYQKTAAVEVVNWKLKNLDRGRSLIEQLVLHYTLKITRGEILKGLADVTETKSMYENLKLGNDFSGIKTLIVKFDAPLVLAVCGSISPYHGLHGERIQNFAGQSHPLQYLTLSTVCIGGHAAYCISSLTAHEVTCEYIDILSSCSKAFIKAWLCTSIFAHIENNYFCLAWWDSLAQSDQKAIASLALAESYTKPIRYDSFPVDTVLGEISCLMAV